MVPGVKLYLLFTGFLIHLLFPYLLNQFGPKTDFLTLVPCLHFSVDVPILIKYRQYEIWEKTQHTSPLNRDVFFRHIPSFPFLTFNSSFIFPQRTDLYIHHFPNSPQKENHLRSLLQGLLHLDLSN